MTALQVGHHPARWITAALSILAASFAARPASAQETSFRAADGSFACSVPAGWTATTGSIGTLPIGVLAPADGGPERVLVFATTVAGTVEQVAQQGAAFTARTFPGVAPEGSSLFGEAGDLPTAWSAYRGTLANGVAARIWSGLVLKGRFAFWTVGLATPESATRGEAATRTVFASMQPGEIPENQALMQAMVGRWEYYWSSSTGTGETSFHFWLQKLLAFGPDGRFTYQVANSEGAQSRAAGSYRVYGNTLYVEIDGGGRSAATGPAVFAIEMPSANGLKIEGELYLRQ